MSNDKEALEILFKNVNENFNKRIRFKNYEVPKLEKDCYNTIKQDLDRLEELEKINHYLNKQLDLFFKNMSANERKACDILGYENDRLYKVIDILKDKLKFRFINLGNDNEWYLQYYNSFMSIPIKLTQEEYELLREVLEDE